MTINVAILAVFCIQEYDFKKVAFAVRSGSELKVATGYHMADVRRLNEFISAFSTAVEDRDGATLTELLQLSNPIFGDSVAKALPYVRDPQRLVARVPEKLGEMLLLYMQCIRSFHQRKYSDAFNEFQQAANLYLLVFRNWDGLWAMPSMHGLVYDLRTLAERADAEAVAHGKSSDKLKTAGSFLMKVFGALAGKGPKRVGSLYVACQLFKIYFKLGTLNLSKSIIRVMDSSKGFHDFPARDQVTYKYYTGRLDVFNDNFVAANEKLSFALERCHVSKQENIRKVLKYLVPVRLALGYLPSNSLLTKYKLREYKGIVAAMRRGDVRLLRDSLQRHEDQFLRAGVFLVLEKLELHVYRRLFKKIHLIQKARNPAKGHQLKMESIVKALKWLEIDMDVDEVECIMATLIFKGLIKGYFSHKSKVAVLSKQDPFPSFTGKALV